MDHKSITWITNQLHTFRVNLEKTPIYYSKMQYLNNQPIGTKKPSHKLKEQKISIHFISMNEN